VSFPPPALRSGSHPSALALLFATLAAGPLPAVPVLNEIHYNNDLNRQLNQFVELYNPDSQDLDVSGWSLSGGVEYTFPTPTVIVAGDYLVIAEHPATILSLFGTVALGPYTGGLSGEGEEIELRNTSGVRIDRVDYGVNFPWPTRADGGGSSMELILHSLDNDLGSSWRSSSTPAGDPAPPTPGAVNSVASDVAPPNIRQVNHLPAQPKVSEAVVIIAKVTDPQGVGSVVLESRRVTPGRYVPAFLAKSTSALIADPNGPRAADPAYQSGWVGVPMLDDGLGDDAVAGDDLYTATLSAQRNRTLVRYRIRVEDVPGEAITVPYADDDALNFAYFVYNGIPDYVAETRHVGGAVPFTHSAETIQSLPAYHLLTTQADYDQCVAYNGADQIGSGSLDARSAFNWSASFVYNGVVYDNIKYRLRQRNDRYGGSGKRSFRFRFNRGHNVQFHDHWGNPYPTKWRTLNSHKMRARGGTNFGLYEAINSILWNTTGTSAPSTHWFHFRVIKSVDEAPSGTDGQHLGDFYGFLLGMEDYDRRFLTAHGLEDGNLYKLKSGVHEGTEIQRYQSPWGRTDGSDYENIIFNLRPHQTDDWIDLHLNLDSWNHYHAIVDAVRHYDVAPNTGEHLKNRAYYFEPSPRNRRFGLLNVFPWDSDTSWGPNWNGGVAFVKDAISNRSGNHRYHVEYRNVVREIRDLIWQRRPISGLIGMLEDQISEFQPADRDRWTGAPASAGNQSDGLISDRAADMNKFAFIGGTWTGGNDPSDPIARDSGISGQSGRDAYLDALADDPDIPDTPTLTDLSAPDHPTDMLVFRSSAFADSSGEFACMEYRIAEYGAYGNDKMPFPLEWNASWESGELATFTAEIAPPASAVRGGGTYRARVRHKDDTGRWSHWSSPVTFVPTEPDISVFQQSLVISEIMYNPPGSDDTEFIELKNIGATPLDLTNIRFTKGIDFEFATDTPLPPGNYLLVVKNTAAFEALYGNGLPIAGEYRFEAENSLSNGGERLKLAFGALAIHDFIYDNNAPWPSAPDGDGYSLVLSHTSDNAQADPLDPLGHGVASNWRSSGLPAGSPGSMNTRSFPGPDPAADDDHDGLNALLEHALASDDGNPSSGPGLFYSGIEDNCLTLSFRRHLLADDVEFLAEVSPDLLTWTHGASFLREVPNGDGTATVTFKSETPLPANREFFMRLRVNQVTPLP